MNALADENTKKPLSSFERQINLSVAQQVEEAEILWKMGRKKDSIQKIEELLRREPSDSQVLETAATLYLLAGDYGKADSLIKRLDEAGHGSSLNVLGMKGELKIEKKDWIAARRIYDELLQRDPENRRYRQSYGHVLAGLREWKRSREIYRELMAQAPGKKDLRLEYEDVVREGAPRVTTEFEYKHRPQTQRDYRIAEALRFWAAPWLQVGLELMEEVYKRRGVGDTPRIRRFLMTHGVDLKAYYGNYGSLAAGWDATYVDQTAFHSLDTALKFDHPVFFSEAGYRWNYLARDPIEAIDRHGVVDRLTLRNGFRFWDRLEPGYEFKIEWFRMDGSRNAVNGADHLGYKFTSDAFVNLVLIKKPYVALNYRYLDSHWEQKFRGASEVIGYLDNEQLHSGGIYSETKIGSHFEAACSITRGSDRKRRADFVYWFFEGRVLLSDDAKLVFSYEYDYGDSGTAGSGNSQIFKGTVDVYF